MKRYQSRWGIYKGGIYIKRKSPNLTGGGVQSELSLGYNGTTDFKVPF